MGPVEAASPELPGLVEIAEVVANGPTGQTRAANDDAQLAAMLTLARSQAQWATVLRHLMPQDLIATYLWVGLACGSYGSSFPDRDIRETVVGEAADVPLIAYKTVHRVRADGLRTARGAAGIRAPLPRSELPARSVRPWRRHRTPAGSRRCGRAVPGRVRVASGLAGADPRDCQRRHVGGGLFARVRVLQPHAGIGVERPRRTGRHDPRAHVCESSHGSDRRCRQVARHRTESGRGALLASSESGAG